MFMEYILAKDDHTLTSEKPNYETPNPPPSSIHSLELSIPPPPTQVL